MIQKSVFNPEIPDIGFVRHPITGIATYYFSSQQQKYEKTSIGKIIF